MVNEPVLDHVDEGIVAVGVGRQQKESRIDQIAKRVIYDSLHDLAIQELELHPDSMDDGRPGMKIEMLVIRVLFEAVYIKDGLDIAA